MSREAIIWDEHSRNYIIEKFKAVQEEASELVSGSLKTQDFIEWLSACQNVLSSHGGDPILQRLSKVIDRATLSPIFNKDRDVKFTSPGYLFKGLSPRVIKPTQDYYTKKWTVDRINANDWENCSRIYIKDEDTDRVKDIYIYSQIEGNNFMTVELEEVDKFIESLNIKIDETKTLMSPTQIATFKKNIENKELNRRQKVWDLIVASDKVKKYSEVIVPEDFSIKVQKEETTPEPTEAQKLARMTPAEKRKLEERTIGHNLISTFREGVLQISTYKAEPKTINLKSEGNKVIYYGDSNSEMELAIAQRIIHRAEQPNYASYSKNYPTVAKYDVYKVAMGNLKHFKQCTPIKDFYYTLKQNKIEMSEPLINWHTAKKIHDSLKDIAFLESPFFKNINEDAHESYKLLKTFHDQFYAGITKIDNSVTQAVLENCDRILEMQLFVANSTDKEAIAEKSMELFGDRCIEQASSVDMRYYAMLLELLDYVEPIKTLLNYLKPMADVTDIQLVTSVTEYCNFKGVGSFHFKTFEEFKDLTPQAVEPEVVEELEEEPEEAF